MATNYLFEIDIVRVDGTERETDTLRFTSLPVNPLLFDHPYDVRITEDGIPTIKHEIQNVFYGGSNVNNGQMKISNSDGEYNYLISDGWALQNRPCRVYRGDNEEAQATYDLIIDGKTGETTIDADTIAFEVNDGTLDLATIPYPDQNATVSISSVVNAVIDAATVEKDSSVDDWLALNGSKNIRVNATNQTLSRILDSVVTPLRAFYGFDESGHIYIRHFELFDSADTPVITLTGDDIMPGFKRASLRRHYWRVRSNYWNGSQFVPVTAKDAHDLNGSTGSIDGGAKTSLSVIAHGFQVGDNVRIYDDTVYQGEYEVQSETTNDTVVINKAYIAHSFSNAAIRNTTQFPFAQDGFDSQGIFAVQGDAQSAADSWLSLLRHPLYKYSVETKDQVVDANILTLGAHVRMVLPQPYGTVDGTVTLTENNISQNSIKLEIVSQ